MYRQRNRDEREQRKLGQLRISTACAEFAGIIDFIKSM